MYVWVGMGVGGVQVYLPEASFGEVKSGTFLGYILSGG